MRKKTKNWKHIARVAAVALAVVAITIVQLKTRNTALAKDAQPNVPVARRSRFGSGPGRQETETSPL